MAPYWYIAYGMNGYINTPDEGPRLRAPRADKSITKGGPCSPKDPNRLQCAPIAPNRPQ